MEGIHPQVFGVSNAMTRNVVTNKRVKNAGNAFQPAADWIHEIHRQRDRRTWNPPRECESSACRGKSTMPSANIAALGTTRKMLGFSRQHGGI